MANHVFGHRFGPTRPANQTRPSFAVGTSLVSLAVKALSVAIRQMTAVNPAMTFHPPCSAPPNEVTMVGAKPAMRNPNWVPMASPEKRTLVLNISE